MSLGVICFPPYTIYYTHFCVNVKKKIHKNTQEFKETAERKVH
nr:MAG TPA: hypothetical protein [Caudoviricetes sp.]